MSRSSVVWTVLAGFAVATFAMLPLRAQEEAKPQAKPDEAQAAEILRFLPEEEPDNESLVQEALERYVSLDSEDLPLKTLVALIAKKCDITVVIDEQALNDEQISKEVAITVSVARVTLRSALKLALDPVQLRAIVEDGVLLITTPAAAMNRLKLVVYDVTDLEQGRRQESGRPILVQIVQDNTGGEPDGPWLNVDGDGGTLSLLRHEDADLLVVRATEAVHRQIEQLFADMRALLEDDAEEGPAIATSAAAIEQRLNRRVNANFDNVSWQSAVQTLAVGLRVPLLMDSATEQPGQVTLRVEKMQASIVLERLLQPRGLGWQATDGGLRIVKAETIEQAIEVQVYDVREFFRIPADAKGLDFKSLIELVERLEGPPKTDDKEPSMTIAGTEMQGLPMLVVKAPHGRQVRIAKLLKELSAARERFIPRGPPAGVLSGGPTVF